MTEPHFPEADRRRRVRGCCWLLVTVDYLVARRRSLTTRVGSGRRVITGHLADFAGRSVNVQLGACAELAEAAGARHHGGAQRWRGAGGFGSQRGGHGEPPDAHASRTSGGFRGEVGSNQRTSATLGIRFLYVAVPLDAKGFHGACASPSRSRRWTGRRGGCARGFWRARSPRFCPPS